jgi:hypothetical protein
MPEYTKRSPQRLVQRFYSERYLLLTLLSFAVSVSLTRLFLQITGFPQLGGGTFHFAHVLWGGLIWFIGSLFPLIFANHRALDISAVLTGVGAGLFIDEVGKFITQSNDYFYPAAAPIIYSFFLITLFIFSLTRKRRNLGLRERLYQVLEKFEEVLESDLSEQERDLMITELSGSFQEDDSSELRRLAMAFKRIIADKKRRLVIQRPDFFDKTDQWWIKTRAKAFPENKKPIWLFSVWMIFGLISILHPIASFFATKSGLALPGFWNELIKVHVNPIDGISLIERLRLIGEAFIGGLLFFSAGAGFFGAQKLGATVAYISLLVLIVLVNLLVFFFDQFSAIFFTIIQFAVLFLTRQYRLLMNNWIFTK